MGWVDPLRGKVIGIDTAPVIYYVEKNLLYIEMLRPFFQLVHNGECAVVTSIVTLLEGLVVPIRKSDTDLMREYYDFLFNAEGVTTISLFPDIAEVAARLRAFYNIRTPDSIQMATALKADASFFLTNDKKFPSIPELKVLLLDDLKANS